MKDASSVPLELMSNLLFSVLDFMEKAGMSHLEVERVFRQCAGIMKSGSSRKVHSKLPSVAIGCDTVAGAVLRAWHREPKFVDDNADPIPLFPRKGKVNLESLIRAQDASVKAESLVREMHRTGLVKKDARGRYLPMTSAATIGQMHPLAIDHVAKTVMRLVETVNRNMRASAIKPSLIERYAHVPDLTADEAKAFSAFTRQQGSACLEAIEDWLESRRTRRYSSTGARRKTSGVSAGVHIFAYIGDQQDVGLDLKSRRKVPSPSRAVRA